MERLSAYYNENDPYAAAWLRNLIAAGHIAPGDVDERSIVDVRPDDLRGYGQCHFFAGIGGWSYALRLAGWPDERPVWTGSCPCQPFSAAGAGKAANDERHLWPAWFPLIAECRPAIVFGEQVDAAIGWGWLDLVFADLEAKGYACGAAVLPSCSVGAPHIRDRVWFVANAESGRGDGPLQSRGRQGLPESLWSSEAGQLAHADGRDTSPEGLQRGGEHGQRAQDGGAGERMADAGHGAQRDPGELGEAQGDGMPKIPRQGTRFGFAVGGGAACELGQPTGSGRPRLRQEPAHGESGQTGQSPWADADWLPCTDGKSRPVEPGTFPLAHGIPRRMGRLRAYGNAITPQVAAEFIRACQE